MAKYKIREIEQELNEVPDELNQPFNPKDIDITVEPRSLDSIISRIRHNEIDMNTHFQRKGDLWSEQVMSRLIESILIRFPLPAFYFDASDDDNWLIVDGLQRLSAIKRFVLNCEPNFVKQNYNQDEINLNRHLPLSLSGLEYFSEYSGLTFDQLPVTMKRRINEATVTAYLIKPGTPEEVKYSVFYRINTGGLQLNAQEIRHALNQKGISAKFLEKLSTSELFKRVVKVSDKRMQDRELILRFLAFSLHHYSTYKPSMIKFLNNVMKEINTLINDPYILDSLQSKLNRSLSAAYELFGNNAFTKSLSQRKNNKGILNRGLFEAWTVSLSHLDDHELKCLLQNKASVLSEFDLLLKNTEFEKSITSSTTGQSQVYMRFSSIEQLLKSSLK